MSVGGGLGRYCGVVPRWNRSMTIMRPPQQGQSFVVCGSAALGLSAGLVAVGFVGSAGMIGGLWRLRGSTAFSGRPPPGGRAQKRVGGEPAGGTGVREGGGEF